MGPGEPNAEVSDVTRDSLEFPASRSAALQTMARGDTGGMLLLAYSNMRGYGSVHPTIGELRVGYLPMTVRHPRTGEPYVVGEVKVTEAEIISKFDSSEGEPRFNLGYGICFGHNEVKAISMAVLDRAMRSKEPKAPSEDQEFVLSHIDGIESMGFCIHFKLPHYVTFQSDLDRIRKARDGVKKKNHVRRVHMFLHDYVAEEKLDPGYNFAFIDEGAKREIRRKILKAIAIPGYQVPFGSRELPIARGWGTGGLQLTLSIIGRDDVLKVIDQGSDDSVNAINIKKFICSVTGVETTTETTKATIIQTRHRIPEEKMTGDQILVLQVPLPDPLTGSGAVRGRDPPHARRSRLQPHVALPVRGHREVRGDQHRLAVPGADQRAVHHGSQPDPQVGHPEAAHGRHDIPVRRRPGEAHLRDPPAHERRPARVRGLPVPGRELPRRRVPEMW